MNNDNYYTASEIADKIGLSKRRVIQLMQDGKVPDAEKVPFKFGSYWRAPKKSSDRFIREYKKNL